MATLYFPVLTNWPVRENKKVYVLHLFNKVYGLYLVTDYAKNMRNVNLCQFGLVARRNLVHTLATKSRPLTALTKPAVFVAEPLPLMKICLSTAQKLPGCTHVFQEDNVAIKVGR